MSIDDDEAFFASVSEQLRDGIVAAVPGWVRSEVERLHVAWSGTLPAEVASSADDAASQAAAEVASVLELVLGPVGRERPTNPLAVVREVVVPHPTRVLADAGVPEVVRDDFEERNFPSDVYRLSPAAFTDLDPDLHELGLVWGAAKAKLHLARRRDRGSS